MFKFLTNSITRGVFKGKNGNRNRQALEGLRGLGYDPRAVRYALIRLNDVKIDDLAGDSVGRVTLYAALNGKSENPEARTLLARSLGLKTEEFFT